MFVNEVLRTELIFPSLTHGSVYSLISSTARSFAELHEWSKLARFEFPPALLYDLRTNEVRAPHNTPQHVGSAPAMLINSAGQESRRVGTLVQVLSEVDRSDPSVWRGQTAGVIS